VKALYSLEEEEEDVKGGAVEGEEVEGTRAKSDRSPQSSVSSEETQRVEEDMVDWSEDEMNDEPGRKGKKCEPMREVTRPQVLKGRAPKTSDEVRAKDIFGQQ